jgi:DNA-binding transcriptional MerR regulator
MPPLVKISELARLSGVPTPTIKHYMREGLLPGPARRTSRNMAYYDARLADRVRAIKDLQQSHFLPLKMIGDLLEPAPSARVRDERLAQIAPAVEAGQGESRRRRAGAPDARLTRAQVLERLQVGPDELAQLRKLGLVELTESGEGEPFYGNADLELLYVIDETRRKGLGDLFPLSILEPYIACVRTLVRVEIELFRRQVLEGAQLPARPLPELASEATQLAERLVIALRSKLILPELQAQSSQDPRAAGHGAEVASARPERPGGKKIAKPRPAN